MKFALFLFGFLAGAFASSPEENLDIGRTRHGNGPILVGGDIAVDLNSAIRGSIKGQLWDNGQLVYEIDSSLDDPTAKAQIQLAMDDWSRTTCIKFKERTTETAYVSFFRGRGCWSYVGKTGRKQQLSLAQGCWRKGTIIHEIGHALGFLHEQSRPDRDNYVEIKFENIQTGREPNFRKSSSIDSLGTPYDYASIMHYGERYFTKNGKPTILPKKSGVTIGQRSNLSPIDIEQMNLLYKCPDVGGPSTPNPPTKPVPGAKYTLIGCFVDKRRKQSAIPYTGKKFKGPTAIVKCAAIASSKGYSAFALQKGKCHTGPQAHETYDKYGKAPDKECKKGLGGRLRNSVYFFGSVTPPPPATPSPPVTGAPQGDCGVSSETRVIGGINAEPGSWPWQIALLRGGGFICGGSLIKPDWVVTAAHCVAGSSNPASYQVRVGEFNRNTNEGTEQTLAVSKVISHSQYNKPVMINNDIALIQFKNPATLNSHVKTVCLPSQDFDVPTSSKCFITGWGKIKHPGSSHPILQQAQMPPVKKGVCAKKLAASPGGSSLQITDQMLCAGVAGTILSGCHGDSGGPYVCQNTAGRWVLQGAVSWGSPRCASSERYTVFARVAKFRNWIDQHTGGN